VANRASSITHIITVVEHTLSRRFVALSDPALSCNNHVTIRFSCGALEVLTAPPAPLSSCKAGKGGTFDGDVRKTSQCCRARAVLRNARGNNKGAGAARVWL